MNRRHVISCVILSTALVLGACDAGRETPGRVGVQVVNVAPGFAELGYRREQRDALSQLGFKGAQSFDYGIDTYDFYVLERELDPSLTGRTWTFSQQLIENQSYTFALTEVAGEVVPVVLEYARAPSAEAQLVGLHAAEGVPALDFYLEPAGTGIDAATSRGTFGPQGQIPARTLAPGDYEFWLTAAGDRTNVLLASNPVTLAAGTTTAFIVTSERGEGTAAISLTLVQGVSAVLYDRNIASELRVINGAADATPRDFAINLQFSPPLFSAAPFAATTSFAPIPAAPSQPINVTPVGNPGVLELDQLLSTLQSQRYTILFAGDAGALAQVTALDDRRRLNREAKLVFYNAATQFGATTIIEFLLVPPDADPTLYAPLAASIAPQVSTTVGLPPSEHDVYVRRTGTTEILAGPVRISVAAGGLYTILAVNGPDTATATIVLLDDFVP